MNSRAVVLAGLLSVVAAVVIGWALLMPDADGPEAPPPPAPTPQPLAQPAKPPPLPPLGSAPPERAAPAPSGAQASGVPAPPAAPGAPMGQRALDADDLRRLAAMKAKLPEPAALPPRREGDAGAPTPHLSAHDVQTAIQAAKPAVAGCYEQALKRTPDLGGRLLVQFTIRQGEGKGSLGDAEIIEDGLGNPFLGMCVIDALAKVDYPAPSGRGEVVVKYPFVLKPAEGEP